MLPSFRYWGVLAAKLAAALSVSALSGYTAYHTVYRADWFPLSVEHWPQAVAGLVGGVFVAPALIVLPLAWCWREQKLRCRVCARRLVMPLDLGSRCFPLTARPRVEYICAWGHGRLMTEIWITGDPPPRWKASGEMWEELFAAPERE